MNPGLVGLLVLTLLPGVTSVAAAQSPLVDEGVTTLRIQQATELQHIDWLGDTATGLYVAGGITALLGLGALVGSVVWGVQRACISWGGGSCPRGDTSGPTALGAAAGLTSLGGLAMLFSGIGFDIETGHQRRAHRARYPDYGWSLAPTDGGLGLALTMEGSF